MFKLAFTKLFKPNLFNLNPIIKQSSSAKMATSLPASNKQAFMPITRQKYDFILVLDFEATCEKNRQIVPQVRN